MQRAKAEYPIFRRAAFLGASAVVSTVGLPVAVKAMEAEAGAGADAGADRSRDLIVTILKCTQDRLERSLKRLDAMDGELEYVQQQLAVLSEKPIETSQRVSPGSSSL